MRKVLLAALAALAFYTTATAPAAACVVGYCSCWKIGKNKICV